MPDLSTSPRIQSLHYRRPFARSLQTASGVWSQRQGILLRIETKSGKTGYGEIAPLPAFGSETFAEAIRYIRLMGEVRSREQLEQGMLTAPAATAFALWSALRGIDSETKPVPQTVKTSGLISLDTGWEKALATARREGVTTFKVKVGIHPRETERMLLSDVLQCLLQHERIRMDANMSWDLSTLSNWSTWLANTTDKVEFIEEPLQPSLADVQQLTRLATVSPVPLALDESLSRQGLSPWVESGWPGYWIIKPSISGIPNWMDRLNPSKVVLSSVFETGIGMNAILSTAMPYKQTCHGLGTGTYFEDGLSQTPVNGSIRCLSCEELDNIWTTLSQS